MSKRTMVPAAVMLVALSAPAARAQEQTSIEPVPPEPATGWFAAVDVIVQDGEEVRRADAGATVRMSVSFTNAGQKAARDAVATLLSLDGYRIVDGKASIGDVEAGSAAQGKFTVEVSGANCSDELGLAATVSSTNGDEPAKWTLPVACPGPRLFVADIRYEGGDGDGVPEPGERLDVTVALRNEGRDPARDVRATIRVDDGAIEIVDGTARWPDIAPGDEARNVSPIVLKVADDAKRQEACGSLGDPVVVDGDKPVASDGGAEPGTVRILPVETASAEAPPSGGGSDGSTDDASTTTGSTGSSIEPDRGDPTLDAPIPRDEEPVVSSDPPVGFSLTLGVAADDYEIELPVGSLIACALAGGVTGGPDKGAPEPATREDDARDLAAQPTGSRQTGSSAPLLWIVIVAALAAASWQLGLAGRIQRLLTR